MIDICPKERCSGCTACMNVCKHNAITMQSDACGFLYPIVNAKKCVDCGICEKTCPTNKTIALEKPQQCYAATVIDERELLSCSSGGVATAISKYIISHGGVVYGCSAKNPWHVQHIRVVKMEDLEYLKGSKYVQSFLGSSFQSIKKDLCEKRLVLFIGTPCQVAGLKGFLHKDYPNLLTIDLVCHGVPSQRMLNDNLRRYCSDEKDVSVSFRRKHLEDKHSRIEFGWEIKKGQEASYSFKPYNKDFYMFGFLRCLTFRENCYSCPYAQQQRVGDLTLCDFWGLRADAGFENGKGVSAVLANSAKGDGMFEQIKNSLVWKQREVSEATRWNGQLNRPSLKPKNYYKFVQLYSNHSFKRAMIGAYSIEYIRDYMMKGKNALKWFLYNHKIIRKL